MSENKIIGIVDEPISSGKSDALKIGLHANSLVRFIENTTTPMTVGIQGEWGSGKTSLLNSIKGNLSENPRYKQIWINSWENSLLTTPEEALIKIINAIIEDLLESDQDKNRKEKIMSAASTVFKGAMRIGAVAALGKKAGDVAEELLETKENGIKALRGQLFSLVDEIRGRKSNPYEKIIIYVDDLDRIEPKDAVHILELLKNIFSVPGCVFILAIDYQVVVKGLEHKFGKQTPENEWEFRAFFDKIIQLPFMMPMGQYDIGNYVSSLLVDVGFIEKDSVDTEDIKEIVLLTIGGNPRSIKRLINSVSLIEIFTEEKLNFAGVEEAKTEETKEEKFLLFSLLCLQIAYPAVYSLLIEEPDFLKWNEDFAFSHTNKEEEKEKELFDKEYQNAIKTEDFDEDWEKALYRICYIRPRLKPRVTDISKFFSFIKDKYTETDVEDLGSTIQEVMSKTSVTSVTSTDQGQERIMNNKSKRLDISQQDKVISISKELFERLKNENSKVFGTVKKTENITGWTRMRKKDLLEDIAIDPLWIIAYRGFLSVNLGKGYPPEHNYELVKYFESKLKDIQREVPGKWEVNLKEGRSDKVVSLAIDDWTGKKGDRSADALSQLEDKKIKNCIDWLVKNVCQFENIIIKICNEFSKIR